MLLGDSSPRRTYSEELRQEQLSLKGHKQLLLKEGGYLSLATSVESNGLSPDTESIQQGPPMESPATETVASSSHMDSCSDCREIVPLQDSPNHTIPQEGTQNQSHFGSTEAHHIRKRQTAEPCWYCMKSLTTDSLKKLQLNLESLSLPSKGKRFSYQQDPRPHFGIPRSSRSTPFALWGCDGPLRRERRTEDTDQMSACPHCHLALPLDTLRWHESIILKGFLF
ncbi:hypothetical protein JZ751_022891 [Albula glossodonta]|uniref:Uncharacterized protein n=1 Tax=Albula glossodonta TaxID=121402 RepID=A0A8T2PHH7_9TELE|nr:hypothetical protein JZ751_022891 [Albula glossodonta]